MTKYTATELERILKNAGRIRKNKKAYTNDADYWAGGACNWGGCHNLKEDCKTLSSSLNKMESLREIQGELKNCTSKQEYDAKRANYIRKCDECLDGLQKKTDSGSSMFGICIIWADEAMDKYVESKIKVCRESLSQLKSSLEKESYQWVQEIKSLELEQKQIEAKMKENNKKAADPNINPAEKALLMQLLDENSKILKKNLEKQKEINKKFHYDPDKYVSELLKKMKESIEKGNSNSRGSGRNRNPHSTPDNNSDSDDDNEENNSDDDNLPPTNPEANNNQSKDWFQENKQLIILGVGLLVVFYLYYQGDEKE